MSAQPAYRDDYAYLPVPPHSTHAEQSVLGGLMLALETLRDVRDLLTEQSFYRRDHQLIYQAMCNLADRE